MVDIPRIRVSIMAHFRRKGDYDIVGYSIDPYTCPN